MLVGVRYNMQILLRTHQHSKPLVGLRYVLWCWWPRTHIMEGCAITRWATLPHTSLLFVPAAGWQWSCDHQKEYVRSSSVSGPTPSHWGSRQKPSLVGISQRVPPPLSQNTACHAPTFPADRTICSICSIWQFQPDTQEVWLARHCRPKASSSPSSAASLAASSLAWCWTLILFAPSKKICAPPTCLRLTTIAN